MATVWRMILFGLSFLSIQINAHLVYQCRRPYEADKSETDTFIYSEAEYRECGAFCVKLSQSTKKSLERKVTKKGSLFLEGKTKLNVIVSDLSRCLF